MYHKHLFDPLGCADTDGDGTAGGVTSTAIDLARIGQMVLNGGTYGDMRFFHPQAVRAMQPIPGRDRFEPDINIRWGVGIKQFDIDGLSDQAFGHPGASGSFLVVDPKRDLVVGMIRYDEGSEFPDFLKRKAVMYKAIMEAIK
jgi:CubicO group peptidase (beta-lactamase class C family)